MFEEFEYRLGHQRRGVWLAATLIVLMMGVFLQTMLPLFIWAIYLLIIVMLAWMMLGVPIAGIRVTDDTLIAAAWRKPNPIPLIDIAEMRAVDWTDQSDVKITLHDGTTQVLSSGDLPSIPILTDVMMERGVYLRDPQ